MSVKIRINEAKKNKIDKTLLLMKEEQEGAENEEEGPAQEDWVHWCQKGRLLKDNYGAVTRWKQAGGSALSSRTPANARIIGGFCSVMGYDTALDLSQPGKDWARALKGVVDYCTKQETVAIGLMKRLDPYPMLEDEWHGSGNNQYKLPTQELLDRYPVVYWPKKSEHNSNPAYREKYGQDVNYRHWSDDNLKHFGDNLSGKQPGEDFGKGGQLEIPEDIMKAIAKGGDDGPSTFPSSMHSDSSIPANAEHDPYSDYTNKSYKFFRGFPDKAEGSSSNTFGTRGPILQGKAYDSEKVGELNPFWTLGYFISPAHLKNRRVGSNTSLYFEPQSRGDAAARGGTRNVEMGNIYITGGEERKRTTTTLPSGKPKGPKLSNFRRKIKKGVAAGKPITTFYKEFVETWGKEYSEKDARRVLWKWMKKPDLDTFLNAISQSSAPRTLSEQIANKEEVGKEVANITAFYQMLNNIRPVDGLPGKNTLKRLGIPSNIRANLNAKPPAFDSSQAGTASAGATSAGDNKFGEIKSKLDEFLETAIMPKAEEACSKYKEHHKGAFNKCVAAGMEKYKGQALEYFQRVKRVRPPVNNDGVLGFVKSMLEDPDNLEEAVQTAIEWHKDPSNAEFLKNQRKVRYGNRHHIAAMKEALEADPIKFREGQVKEKVGDGMWAKGWATMVYVKYGENTNEHDIKNEAYTIIKEMEIDPKKSGDMPISRPPYMFYEQDDDAEGMLHNDGKWYWATDREQLGGVWVYPPIQAKWSELLETEEFKYLAGLTWKEALTGNKADEYSNAIEFLRGKIGEWIAQHDYRAFPSAKLDADVEDSTVDVPAYTPPSMGDGTDETDGADET